MDKPTPFYEVWEDCLRMAEEILGEAAKAHEAAKAPRVVARSVASTLSNSDNAMRAMCEAAGCDRVYGHRRALTPVLDVTAVWGDGFTATYAIEESDLELDWRDALQRAIASLRAQRDAAGRGG